jgi:hypothetical protein
MGVVDIEIARIFFNADVDFVLSRIIWRQNAQRLRTKSPQL